jgi:hypothetical protein
MGLMGTGVLVNWGGVVESAEDDYNAWHSLEHMPERLAVPGFRRGRRAVAAAGTPAELKYFMMYEVDSPDVLVSAPYLARLNDPTPWTRRILAQYVAPSRTVCRVLASTGRGCGGYVATLQVAPRDLGPALDAARGDWIGEVMAIPGIIGAHAIEGDTTLGQMPTAEKKFRESRGDRDRTVALALLIDGLDGEATTAALQLAQRIAAQRMPGESVGTVYRTQHVIVHEDTIG